LGLLREESRARLLDCGCCDGELTVKAAEVLGASTVYNVDTDEDILSITIGRGKGF